mmetsp:Transcript_25300/g.35488  ORF Transcript_25300/g.35488 Transcript_25300/m.35488 type:complete len:123 (-) Transcript_25300:58-426(-)
MVDTPFFVERLLSLSDMFSCVKSFLPFPFTEFNRRVEGVTTENAIEEHARSKRAMIERTKAFIFLQTILFLCGVCVTFAEESFHLYCYESRFGSNREIDAVWRTFQFSVTSALQKINKMMDG